MPENYEVVYTHPSGATATFIRHDGELDALAKGLDAEQFWVFKNVKSLLVRNEAGDLEEAHRLMGDLGFVPAVRAITRPRPAAEREPAFAVAPTVAETYAEEHHGPHLPGPSYWPLALAASATVVGLGWLFIESISITLIALGFIGVFISVVGWGVESV